MPEPGSIIPDSGLTGLAAPVPTSAPVGAPLKFETGVPEVEFLKHFPLRFKVQAVTIYEAKKQGWVSDRSYWQFLEPFRYVSDQWGPIEIPKGFCTDFASVPPRLHSVIDDDSPIILFPSAPHDFLFTKRKSDGTRGWLPNGEQLSLAQVNHLLTEAMAICGASLITRELVFAAVEIANEGIRAEFAP